MSTIPNEVLLRIIETSKDKPYRGPYALKDCRIHCKNYFNFICDNYFGVITPMSSDSLGYSPTGVIEFFENGYIQNAEDVSKMLKQAKQLLDKNSKARRPR
jgi:hypothetical protein